MSHLHPLVLHRAAWRAFNTERENREAGHPASWIQLAKKHVDALPEAIRGLFDEK